MNRIFIAILAAATVLAVPVAAEAHPAHHHHHSHAVVHRAYRPAPPRVIVVTPLAPTWHQVTCALPRTDGSVDIPVVRGVEYALDTIPGPADNYLIGLGTHTVQAFALPGFALRPGVVSQWSFTVVAPTGCIPVHPPVTYPGASPVPTPTYHPTFPG